jgi:hypothetical protein
VDAVWFERQHIVRGFCDLSVPLYVISDQLNITAKSIYILEIVLAF